MKLIRILEDTIYDKTNVALICLCFDKIIIKIY